MTKSTSANSSISKPAKESPRDNDAISLLMGRINYERTSHIPYGEQAFKLDRMRSLAQRLGNPQNDYPIIHVAGSKGKGSTSTMIASILSAAGYRTGLFTSPHLRRFNERIVIDGNEVTDEELDKLIASVMPTVEVMDAEAQVDGMPFDKPTFFEIITAIALVHFRNRQVDAVVLEVGLGGRLDSTNICSPVCSVITSIGLDHTRQLGDTHAQIAGEKAGIIKPDIPIISTVAHPEAMPVIRDRAQELNATLWSSESDFEFDYRSCDDNQSIDFRLKTEQANVAAVSFERLVIAMLGRHQARNAAAAVMTSCVLNNHGFQIDEEPLRAGLSQAVCRGRIEVVSSNPTIILDTAHNVSSINALLTTLNEEVNIPRDRRIVLMAATRGKDVSGMLKQLIDWCGELIITKYQDNPRGMKTARLAQLIQATPTQTPPNVHRADDPQAALLLARELANNDSLICITGSFFLAAEVEPFLRP